METGDLMSVFHSLTLGLCSTWFETQHNYRKETGRWCGTAWHVLCETIASYYSISITSFICLYHVTLQHHRKYPTLLTHIIHNFIIQ